MYIPCHTQEEIYTSGTGDCILLFAIPEGIQGSFQFPSLRVHCQVVNNAVNVIEAIIDGISTIRDELISPGDLASSLREKEQVAV
jgi:hypothetical protein